MVPLPLSALFANQELVGALTLLSAVAATAAAVFAWRQVVHQRRRWHAEDARVSPTVFIGLSGGYSNDGWFHGVWQLTNRAAFPLELLRIEAVRPRNLFIGALDVSTDGPVEGMKVVEPGRKIAVSRVIPVKRSPSEAGLIGSNFLYRLSETPDKDRGRSIRLRFVLREVDNPAHQYEKYGEAVIPIREK